MNTLQVFFTEFWPETFLDMAVVAIALWFTGRSQGSFFSVSPKSFRELARFDEDERKRLFQEASKETFHSWRSTLPFVAFAFLTSAIFALAATIPKVTALPDAWWLHFVLTVLIGYVALGLEQRITVSCIRPCLRRLIECDP